MINKTNDYVFLSKVVDDQRKDANKRELILHIVYCSIIITMILSAFIYSNNSLKYYNENVNLEADKVGKVIYDSKKGNIK